METKVVKQSDLTADCWPVQVWGISACDDCVALNTTNCGGKSIRKKILRGEFSEKGLPSINEKVTHD